MAKQKKGSFFERLTGTVKMSDEENENLPVEKELNGNSELWQTNGEETDGELALDVYQTPSEVIVQTFVAGVKPEDLEINITRDMLTLRGKRVESKTVKEDDYFSKELYWGSFSRTVSLPQEVEPEEAEAIERHGLLTIRLPKIDKNKKSHLKVKSL
ncbi:MAG: Hsp20/alpha crystallin family protein [bacterium]